jgi:hypothetical protein
LKTKLLTPAFILLLFGGFYFYGFGDKAFQYKGLKMKGLSLVAPPREVDITCFHAIQNVNADWVSLMPYAFVPKGSAKVRFEIDTTKKHPWWGETPAGVKRCIEMAHSKGIKVMLKPHLWLGWGQFTGNLNFEKDSDWKIFEESFKEYILTFARLAESEKVEVFCIATEMGSHVQGRKDYWFGLISDVKKVYKGKLTYAENWDCFEKVPFWEELDFIGVDGYFPLSDEREPSVNQLNQGWKRYLKKLDKYAAKQQKSILFTEIGYKSNDYSTEKPWETDYSKPKNESVQAKAYQSFFESAWKQSWCAGAFIWKWFPTEINHFHERETFSPQGKMAVKVLGEHYGK